ncbi:MAG TPA: ABC transporter substrate-binding protein [Solirubrobacteraceae bacterium]|jgi:peptide/nickel transport system substrate-binding protein|nr:ABC transporter substrate-binding protein [Solirubrobacteraceae bacterium]
MRKRARLPGAIAIGLILVFVLAACGSSSSNNSTSSSGGAASTGAAKQGGTIKIGTVGPDSYDPQEYQTVQADSAMHLVYEGLLAFKDATGQASTELVPALADAIPTPTNGGKTYVFHIRSGLHYSDGEPVEASDVVNMVKRNLFLGGPFSSFFNDIVGATKYAAAKKTGAPLTGMIADDKTGKLTIHLMTPDTRVLYAFAIGESGVGPKSKAVFKNMTGHPFPGDGPYTLKVVSPSPTNGEFILTKNPKFDIPTIAKGNVNQIDGMVSTNVNTMTENVINGTLDYMTEDPVGDLLPQVEAKYKDRFLIGPGYPNTYYFFMNSTLAPFNKLAAREAVNYAIDSRALERIFGGRLHPTCNLLPPGMVGYTPITPCPWGDPNGPGNIAKAQALVKSAGLTGSPVTVWTNTKDPRPAIADYLRSTLDQIGFKASTKTVNQTVYFSTIGDPKTKAQIGFDDWFQDFPHPGDFMGNLLTTAAAKSLPSFNSGFVSNPYIDSQVNKLDAQPAASVASGWAALDKYVNDPQHAYVVPYGNEEDTAFYSTRMNVSQCSGYPNLAHRVDWSLLCLK